MPPPHTQYVLLIIHINLKVMMLGEISQANKTKHMTSLVCKLKHKTKPQFLVCLSICMATTSLISRPRMKKKFSGWGLPEHWLGEHSVVLLWRSLGELLEAGLSRGS